MIFRPDTTHQKTRLKNVVTKVVSDNITNEIVVPNWLLNTSDKQFSRVAIRH